MQCTRLRTFASSADATSQFVLQYSERPASSARILHFSSSGSNAACSPPEIVADVQWSGVRQENFGSSFDDQSAKNGRTTSVDHVAACSSASPTCCDATLIRDGSFALAIGFSDGSVRITDVVAHNVSVPALSTDRRPTTAFGGDSVWDCLLSPPSTLQLCNPSQSTSPPSSHSQTTSQPTCSYASTLRWNQYFSSQLLVGYGGGTGAVVSLFSAPCSSPVSTRHIGTSGSGSLHNVSVNAVVAAEWVSSSCASASSFLSPSHAAISTASSMGSSKTNAFVVSIVDFRASYHHDELRLGVGGNDYTGGRAHSARGGSQIGGASMTSEQISQAGVVASGLCFHPTRPLLATYGNAEGSGGILVPIVQIWDVRYASSPVAYHVGGPTVTNAHAASFRHGTTANVAGGVWEAVWGRTSTSTGGVTDNSFDNYSLITLFGAQQYDREDSSAAIGTSTIGVFTFQKGASNQKRVLPSDNYDDSLPTATIGIANNNNSFGPHSGGTAVTISRAGSAVGPSAFFGTSSMTMTTRNIGEPLTSITPLAVGATPLLLCYCHQGRLSSISLSLSDESAVTPSPVKDESILIQRAEGGFGVDLSACGEVLVGELVAVRDGSTSNSSIVTNTVAWTVLMGLFQSVRLQSAKHYVSTRSKGLNNTFESAVVAAPSPSNVLSAWAMPADTGVQPSLVYTLPAVTEGLSVSSSGEISLLVQLLHGDDSNIPWLLPQANAQRAAFFACGRHRWSLCAQLLREAGRADGSYMMVCTILSLIVEAYGVDDELPAPQPHVLATLNDLRRTTPSTAPYLVLLVDLLCGLSAEDMLAREWSSEKSSLDEALVPFDVLLLCLHSIDLSSSQQVRALCATAVSKPFGEYLPVRLLLSGVNDASLLPTSLSLPGAPKLHSTSLMSPTDLQCVVALFTTAGVMHEFQAQHNEDRRRSGKAPKGTQPALETAGGVWRQWHEQYRTLLDTFGNILMRSEYDLALRQLYNFGIVIDRHGDAVVGAAPIDVEFTHTCEAPLRATANNSAKNGLANATSSGGCGGAKQTVSSAAVNSFPNNTLNGIIVNNNIADSLSFATGSASPHELHSNDYHMCQFPMPKCGVCGISVERLLPPALTPPPQWLVWCTSCGHGGHSAHIAEWFSRHELCPFPLCPCSCRAVVGSNGEARTPTISDIVSYSQDPHHRGSRGTLDTTASIGPLTNLGTNSSSGEAIGDGAVYHRHNYHRHLPQTASLLPHTATSAWGNVAYHFTEFPLATKR